jgi:hypothetical protein
MMSFLATFGHLLLLASILAFFAEAITVSYTYCLQYMFGYLKDEDAEYTTGIWMVCAYAAAIIGQSFFRNYYIYVGYLIAIKMRKVII